MLIAQHSSAGEERRRVLAAELQTQTDRGAAIVAAAWLEDAMTYSLNKYFKSHQESWKRLFEGSGPMATLSAKIDISRLVGLITTGVRSDLHMIRTIRNDFAHQVAIREGHSQLTFTSPHIKDKCMALKSMPQDAEHAEPRERYVATCVALSSDFDLAVDLIGYKIPNDGLIFCPSESHGA